MGSWNGTCALTQLPIGYDEPVRLVILMEGNDSDKERSPGGFVHSTGLWFPIGVPLRGTYNTYGSIYDPCRDDGPDEANAYGLNGSILRANVFPNIIPHKDERRRNIDVSPTSTWHLFLRALERGVVRATKYGQQRRVGQALIREDVYQAALAYTWENWWAKQMVNASVIRADARVYLARILAENAEDKADPEGALRRTTMRIAHDEREGLFESGLRGEDGRGVSMLYYDHFIRDGLRKGTLSAEDPALLALLDDLADLMAVRSVMRQSRKFWSPQSGAGSQDEDLDVHVYLADTVKAIVAAKKKQDEEEM